MKRHSTRNLFAAAAALAAAGALAQTDGGGQARPIPAGDWPAINRDAAATRYSPLNQIDTSNVGALVEAWSYSLGTASSAVPVVVDSVMYVTAGDRVVALDGETGRERWVHALGDDGPRTSTRGLAYWPGDAERAPRILFMAGAELRALDARSGRPVREFGGNGSVDTGVPYNGPPTIYRDIALIGATLGEVTPGPAGNPRAFDVRTGEKLWEFQTVPRPGEPYNETWGGGWAERSGANMWAFAAPVDAARGLVYLPIAGPAPNYWGGDRPGSNVFANSIVAVDVLTGVYRWHFQTVHHDLWDSDMPSAGALVDVVRDGKRLPAIAHVGKTSYVFVLDRATGKPLIDVEERPVPRGDVPGEWYSPTQPFPVRPPPLSRVSLTREEIVTAEDTTPEHADACQAFWERSGGFYNAGPFTPFNFHARGAAPRSTIQFPGGTGGVNWGGIAADPNAGIIYANAHDTSLVGWLEERDPELNYGRGTAGSKQPYDRGSILGAGPYFSFNAPVSGEFDEQGRGVGPSLPCSKPPWGRLVAVDVNRGEILWTSTLGLNEALPPGKQLVGASGSAGPSVTAGGLVFVGATSDRRFRAFDSRTGEELWSSVLEANANANPMSYEAANGRQHVAVVAGDRVMVYALP
jgi:quinoprotein glucose dehydrogenase